MRGTEAKTGAAEKGRFLQPHLWFAPTSSQSDVQLALGRSPKRPSAGPEAQSEFVRTDEGRRGRGVKKKKKKGASPAGVVPQQWAVSGCRPQESHEHTGQPSARPKKKKSPFDEQQGCRWTGGEKAPRLPNA